MKWLFAGLLLVHGLIHLMGFAKAFGYLELPQLTVSISRPLGVGWLLAAGLFVGTFGALFAWPRGFWQVGAIAVLLSQVVILASFRDAKFGTIANLIVLVGVIYGVASEGPASFRVEFEKEVGERLRLFNSPPILTGADVAPLPAALRKYLTHSGAVGAPRVQNFHATFTGRIRGGPNAAWMNFTGEQYNFEDRPARFFIIDASMYGLPVQAFHRFEDSSATMRVKVLSIFPMVDAAGPEMTRAETVTLFNDMCVFAPGALADPRIQWREVDALHIHGTFTNAGVTIQAVLTFNDEGELVDFVYRRSARGLRRWKVVHVDALVDPARRIPDLRRS